MSLIVSWVGKDSHGYSSAYIASDSRVSWNDSDKFDSCRKTYFSKRFPDIVGYCGDVLFPTLILQTIFELIDSSVLINNNASCSERFDIFRKKLTEEISKYPSNKTTGSFEIIYISHEIVEKGYPKFTAFLYKWSKGKRPSISDIVLPDESGIINIMGSGSDCFKNQYENYKRNKISTTRYIFHSFILSLENMTDVHCGGAPQLVGIYRKPGQGAFSYGIIYNNNRYYNGIRIDEFNGINTIEWRNKYFEICDGITKKKKPEAMKQPMIQVIDLATP